MTIKRIACIFSLIIILMISSAVAEDFTFRNGITFHDTVSEVAEKENNRLGKSMLSEPYGDTNDMPPAFHKYFYTYISNHGTIAGIPESSIMYKFNSQKELREASYTFKTHQSSQLDSAVTDFEGIEQALIYKYGDPIHSSAVSNLYPVKSESLDYDIDLFSELDLSIYNEYSNFSEWIIDFQDYKVKIEHYMFCVARSEYSQNYIHKLCYCYFTDEDLYSVLNSEQLPYPEPPKNIIDDL